MTQSDSKFWLKVDTIAVLAGLLYCSWPLGGWLNPAVAAHGLASDLGGRHEPYGWLFSSGDTLSSLLVLVICWLVWQQLRTGKHRRLVALVLVNLAVFAVGTMIAALLPLRCDPALHVCPNFLHDYVLLIHGLGSILSSLCLFASALVLWFYRRTRLLSIIVAGYLVFGIFAIFTSFGANPSNWSQHYYITLCSLWLAILPLEIRIAAGQGRLLADVAAAEAQKGDS